MPDSWPFRLSEALARRFGCGHAAVLSRAAAEATRVCAHTVLREFSTEERAACREFFREKGERCLDRRHTTAVRLTELDPATGKAQCCLAVFAQDEDCDYAVCVVANLKNEEEGADVERVVAEMFRGAVAEG